MSNKARQSAVIAYMRKHTDFPTSSIYAWVKGRGPLNPFIRKAWDKAHRKAEAAVDQILSRSPVRRRP